MFKLLILISFVSVLSLTQANLMPKTWITSCKPCNDILTECLDCIGSVGCNACVAEIENSKCSTCSSDLKRVGDSMYCDGNIDYHRSSCTFNCRARDNVPFFKTGTCSVSTGKCDCYYI